MKFSAKLSVTTAFYENPLINGKSDEIKRSIDGRHFLGKWMAVVFKTIVLFLFFLQKMRHA